MSRRIAVLSLIGDLEDDSNTNRLYTFATHVDGARVAHSVATIYRGRRARDHRRGNARQRFSEANIEVLDLGEQPISGARRGGHRRPARGRGGGEIGYSGPRLRRMVGALCRLVHEREIDVIDAHRGAGGLVAVMAGAITGTPVMVTPRMPYVTMRQAPHRAAWLAGQMGLSGADALITCSTHDRHALARWLLQPGVRRIAVVPPGVEEPAPTSLDERASALARLGVPAGPGACVIGMVGQAPAAGPLGCDHTEAAWLARAVQPVMAEHPHVHLVLPGRELPAELYALVTNMGIAARVHVVPWERARAQLVPHVDILVASGSAAPEPVLEGMALARPLVTTTRGAPVDLVEHEVSAVVVPVGASRAAGQALEALVSDPAAARRLGQAARARYLEQHTPAVMTRRLEGLMSELAARRRAPVPVDRGQIFGLGRILEVLQDGR